MECIGFVLAGLGYMYVDCSKASLLLTSVTLFTALFGYLLLGETLTLVESVGGALVVLAVLIIYHEALLKMFGCQFDNARKEAMNEGESRSLLHNNDENEQHLVVSLV